MKILDYLSPPDVACQRTGPHDRIVLSSRVRLARNLPDLPFPGHAKKADRIKAYDLLMPLVSTTPQMGPDPFAEGLDKLAPLDKQVLVERHLISREHAAKSAGSGFVLNREESFCVMVNEEDHLRMQALRPGLQLKQAWLAIDSLDSALQEKVPFAYADQYGYLTACPTNLGTGIRVSAMLHLPGLVLAEHINQIIQAVNKLGLAVRGLYGEGTEALGNIFQVSNQQTLGESESEIVERLNKVALQIIEAEQNARAAQLEKKPRFLFNHIGRAYGILSQAHVITSKETMNLLSLLRLGVDLGMFEGINRSLVDELFLISQPWHLQLARPEKLDAEQRDALRAELLRARMRQFPAPDPSRIASHKAA
jgi:protein arginine kinase